MATSRSLMFVLIVVQIGIVGLLLLYTTFTGNRQIFQVNAKEKQYLTVPPNFDPFRKVSVSTLEVGTTSNQNFYRNTSDHIGHGFNAAALIGIHSFPSLPSLFPVPRRSDNKVPRAITADEYATLMRLVNLSMSVLDAHNISYTLTYGSLIGSYLMHDMLPWDDDVDIFVHNDTKAKVMDLFKDGRHCGIRGYHHSEHPGYLFKVFFDASKSAGKYPWNWPFIDIATFVDSGKDHLKAVERSRRLIWPKDAFYPNHLRPFGPLWLPVPRHPWVFLTAMPKYKSFECKSSSWNHTVEKGQQSVGADCSALTDSYPFVKRSPMANITFEILVLSGKELYGIFIDEPYHKQTTLFRW